MKKLLKFSLFYQYLFLYFIAVFIPILMTSFVLFASYKKLQKEVVQTNQFSLQLIQHTIDSKIIELGNTLLFIEQDPFLTKNSVESNPYQAITSLNKTVNSDSFINNIILHVRNTPNFYSSYGKFCLSDLEDQDFSRNLIQQGYSSEEWIHMLNSATELTFWPTNNFNKQTYYLYLFSPVLSSYQYDAANTSRAAAFLIRRDYIDNLFLASQTDMEEHILLLNSNLEILHYLAPSASEEFLLQICEQIKSFPVLTDMHSVTYDGTNYMLFISQSKETGLYYVRLLAEQKAFHTVYTVRTYITITLILVIVVGIFLIAFGLRRSYTPIRILANKIEGNIPAPTASKNELLLLEQTFDKIFKLNTSLSTTIQNSRYGLQNEFLSSVIQGKFSSEETFYNACKNLNIVLDKKYFSVCSILVEQQNEDNETTLNIEILDSVVQDRLPESLHILIKDLLFARKMLFVLNSDSNDTMFYYSTMTTIQNRLLNELGLLTTIGIGTFYDSYEQIGKSYLESVNALDYRMIYGKGSLITSDIYNNSLADASYPTSILEQMYSALKSNDISLAIASADQLYEYSKSKTCSLHTAKYICFDIFALLKKLPFYANTGYVNTLSQTLNITQLACYETIDEFYSSLINILQNTVGFVNEQSKVSDSEIGEQFVKYIHENCFSYDFQISAMAEHFSISSQYMRKLFRTHTGQGISEYVTNMKLEKAMQLLQETDLSMQDITLEIGLSDVSGFTKLFKKRLGITPSQYRRANKCE